MEGEPAERQPKMNAEVADALLAAASFNITRFVPGMMYMCVFRLHFVYTRIISTMSDCYKCKQMNKKTWLHDTLRTRVDGQGRYVG